MNLKRNFKYIKFSDLIIFLFLIIISLIGILITGDILNNNNDIYIEVDGKLKYVLSIEEDKIISIRGILGYTQIEIKNKKVRVISSPCKNKDCIKQGWIDKGIIICLPNRVIIRIGKDKKEIIDGITG